MNTDSRRFVEHGPLGGHSAAINTIPHHVILLVECRSCGRRSELDRERLNARAQHASLREIEPRLRCSCGKKSARLMAGYWPVDMTSGNNS